MPITNTNAAASGLKPSGWESHADSQYTAGAPFSYATAAGWVSLPNDGLGGQTSIAWSPADVTLAVGNLISGRSGDSIQINVELTAVPTVNNQELDVAIDIGGGVGRIYERQHTFPRGTGIARAIGYSHMAYTLGTWEANGGQLVFSSDANLTLYAVRLVVGTLHRN